MATNPAVPFWDEGNTITARGSAAITGKRFVTVSGARIDDNPAVAHAAGTATTKALGVSARDAAVNEPVTVYSAPGLVMPVTTADALTAGAAVYSAADGRATTTATGVIVGYALDDAAPGTDALIKLA